MNSNDTMQTTEQNQHTSTSTRSLDVK